MLPSLTSAPLGFSPGAASPNMNGDYILTRTPQAGDTKAKFPTHFADYPSLGLDAVESFDVYSPSVSSLYSQVFWKGLPPVDLPAHVVEKYRGRGMAIVGFELDQVRRTPQGDVSLPMTFAYNHHFESTLIGSRASFRKRGAAEAAAAAPNGHGHGRAAESYEVVEHEAGALPSSLALGAANGGEVRKSFHGYAPGFVQVVESPTQFQITPCAAIRSSIPFPPGRLAFSPPRPPKTRLTPSSLPATPCVSEQDADRHVAPREDAARRSEGAVCRGAAAARVARARRQSAVQQHGHSDRLGGVIAGHHGLR